MKTKTSIFVVHEYETSDGTHHLNLFKNNKAYTTHCANWADAFNRAFKKARKLGLRSFQIDHPDLPHVWVKVT